MALALGIIPKESLPNPRSQKFYPVFLLEVVEFYI